MAKNFAAFAERMLESGEEDRLAEVLAAGIDRLMPFGGVRSAAERFCQQFLINVVGSLRGALYRESDWRKLTVDFWRESGYLGLSEGMDAVGIE